ncbi:MAG: UbiA family prenyltransferase [Saprospiraceae bacterium]|nr:UbiA family prenyltransferase [Saprospiraceae bacterium]
MLTQFALQYKVIVPLAGTHVLLDGVLFPLFTVVTALVAGSGYIINDIFDYQADKLNKPEKCYIPEFITTKQAWIYFFILVLAGFIIAAYIAVTTQTIFYLGLYPLSVILLYLYSARFKSTILAGNILVSLFIACVTGVVFLAQSLYPGQDRTTAHILTELCALIMTLSFLLNLIREIVKDLEDIEGDSATGLKTIATGMPAQRIKIWLNALIICTLILVIVWLWHSAMASGFMVRVYFLIFITAPLILMIQKIKAARIKRDYGKISQLSKLIMLAGILSIFIITAQL